MTVAPGHKTECDIFDKFDENVLNASMSVDANRTVSRGHQAPDGS